VLHEQNSVIKQNRLLSYTDTLQDDKL